MIPDNHWHKYISPSLALAFFLLFLIAPAFAGSDDLQRQLLKSSREQVIEVIDGDTVILKDHTRVRLVGIQAPKLPLGRKNYRAWPFGLESKELLSRLVLHKYVTLYYGGERRDRYDRALAHLFRDDGLWVQGEMLKKGMARVYSFADNRAIVTEMMQQEKEARQGGLGIWSMNYYQPLDQAHSARHENSFQLVTGMVKAVAKVKGTYYLNFGDNWKEDFTIVIKGKAARLFIKVGMMPERLAGKEIEVRGWLKSYNGPMIEATHPEQITIIK